MKCLIITSLVTFYCVAFCADNSQKGIVKNCVKVSKKNQSSEPSPAPILLEVSHREPRGIGYPDGYTSLRSFYYFGNYRTVPFVDLRGHVFNDGKVAFNAGLGLRSYMSTWSLGANVYWDFRQARHADFNQIAGGLEFLLPHFKIWANGYIPLGSTKNGYRKGFSQFQGNQALFFRKFETAMYGTDIGFSYFYDYKDLFTIEPSLGGYYFQGNFNESAVGGLLRLKAKFKDYFSIEGQVSYDSHFKWIGQGQVALGLRLGPKKENNSRKYIRLDCKDTYALERRVASPPDRFEIMPTATHKKVRPAIDPLTGLPLNFIFVDNLSSSTGTFESPFATLAAAEAASGEGDVIYVFPGDGTTTGMNMGITLKNRQSLAGSAAALAVSTPFGLLSIPAQTSLLPKISNPGSDAVIITNTSGCLISGLNIRDSSFGIRALSPGFNENTTIQNNQFENNVSDDVNLQTRGQALVKNNIFSSLVVLNTFTSGVSSITSRDNLLRDGVRMPLVVLTSESAELIAINNRSLERITAPNVLFFDMNLFGGADVRILCSDNIIQSSGECIRIENSAHILSSAVVKNNTCDSTGVNAFNIVGSGINSLSFENNRASDGRMLFENMGTADDFQARFVEPNSGIISIPNDIILLP